MTGAFLETPRFPDNISYGAVGGPEFKTFIFEANSGVEQRSKSRDVAKYSWNVAHGIRDKADMTALLAFFLSVAGRACGFRFKDWSDFELTAHQIGVGDSTTGSDGTALFNISQTYTTGALSHVRRVHKIVATPIPVIFIDGTPESAANYTIDFDQGTVTFSAPNHPLAGELITITCEFDVPVRFNVDKMDISLDFFDTESWTNIQVISLADDEVEP